MIEKKVFGTTKSGDEVTVYILKNTNGMEVECLNYGAAIVSVKVPNAKGECVDVVLGYDTVSEYETNDGFFGVAVGPNANRIDGAQFTIGEVTYQLDQNENTNNLHSHRELGLHKKIWDAEIESESLKLHIVCEDGELGFPGKRTFTITYTLSEDNTLSIAYDGISDQDTVMNMTNHTYFNLAGQGSVIDHVVQLCASKYTPVREDSIPRGEMVAVENSPYDFRQAKRVGDDLHSNHPQIQIGAGYDMNFCIDDADGTVKEFGTLTCQESGLVMKMSTDLPGVQMYTGNFIAETTGKKGASYGKYSGICFETQGFPNAINEPNFPSVIYGPNKPYHTSTHYQFVAIGQ